MEVRQLINMKRQLRSIWKRTRHPSDKRNFNRAVSHVKNKLKELKNNSVRKFLIKLDPANNNEHNLWRATKYLKRSQTRNIPIKNNNSVWCRSDKSKAETFKTFLESIFKPFSFCSAQEANEISNFIDVPCQMSRPIKPFRLKEVLAEVKKLNTNKSPGYDLIDSTVLKALPQKALVYMTTLFNAVLRLSYFPTQWKHAKIIMILKPKKPEHSAESYRPISLLPIISKLFERLIKKRLSPILESLQILPDHQFGFRNNHGTPEQCHRVVRVIRDALEKQQYSSAVFLDVKQAFDRVWHNGLLYKLKQILPAPFYVLLKSYLNDRSFYVNVNDENSEIGSVKSGVPQGSVLGPILFTIYTADLPTRSDVMTATYADDTAIIATNESASEASSLVQSQLDLISKWLKKWNIKVNADKSTHVTYTLKQGDCPPVYLDGALIPKSNHVKYLGLNIDRRLNWKKHLQLKRKQLDIKTKKMYWLLGPNSELSLNNKLIIYKTVLKPIWTYGIQLWGTASYSNIDIIQKYQSKTLRLITKAPWFVRNNNIHSDLDIPKVKEEIKRYSSNYMNRLSYHENILAITLLDDTNEVRRLKRRHILDLPFLP